MYFKECLTKAPGLCRVFNFCIPSEALDMARIYGDRCANPSDPVGRTHQDIYKVSRGLRSPGEDVLLHMQW